MELMLLEKQACDFVGTMNIPVKEKMKRVSKVLDLINTVYNKYGEEIEVEECYNILYFEELE